MTIAKDKMVSVTYELKLDGKNGDVFEKAVKDSPLIFLYGSGMMLPAFESGLSDKNTSDTFEISIAAADAYGEVNEEAIVDLPKNIFMVDGKIDEQLITPGNSVPMMSTSGQRMEGLVVSVNEDTVQMDFNHPLAGEDLYFTGEILDIRDATTEELNAAYSSGCGCGSGGGCGDGGCDSGGCDSDGCGDEKSSGCGCC
ncbi:MAG: FKBP-type peptidyl-prolyl cis-trans isomerase [Bacteroidia bacterium]|nr:FKBP-type peptidyl-prolyl cis-trans isomerase [Bacteroidia bacterium]